MKRALASLAVCLGCLAGCVSGDESPSAEAIASAVVGGTAATTCVFPNCMMGRGCSSTLVHPGLVTTAAHCVQDMQMDGIVNVGETAPFIRTVQRKLCRRPPQYTNANAAGQFDIAFCLLQEEINDVPIVPVLSACEAEQVIKAGKSVIIAGFGAPNNGKKYWGNVMITGLRNGAEVLMRGEGVVAGAGDSGGPGYLKMPDGTWRTFGVGSRAGGNDSIYTLISPHVAWIEKESGLDITPCHNAAGGWEGGPGCDRFPTDPSGTANGTWADMCRASPVAKPTQTCPATWTPDGGTAPVSDARPADPRPDAGRDAEAPPVTAPDAAMKVPDASAPADASSGSGGAGGGAGAGGAIGTPIPTPTPKGGCACAVGGSGGGVNVLVAGFLVLALRRRRPRTIRESGK